MVNKVLLIGRLGGDPEVRQTSGGKAVANFNLATDEKNGENKVTTWHRLVLWEKLAEIAEKYLHKGDLIYVEGRIQNRQYEDTRDGSKKNVSEIVVFTLKMLGSPSADQERPAAKPAPKARAVQQEDDSDDGPGF